MATDISPDPEPTPSPAPAPASASKPESISPIPTPVVPPPVTGKTDPFAESVTIKLNFPIKVGGHEVLQLTMRRPKVRDRLNLSAADSDMEVLLIGNLCGVSPDEMAAMDMSDLNVFTAHLVSFTNPGRSRT